MMLTHTITIGLPDNEACNIEKFEDCLCAVWRDGHSDTLDLTAVSNYFLQATDTRQTQKVFISL